MRRSRWWWRSLLVIAVSLAAACSRPVELPAATPVELPPRVETRSFHSDAFASRLTYPSELVARRSFKGSYLANDGWKTYAPADSVGEPVFALVLPESNAVTSAELRVGVSASALEVSRCLSPPDAMRAGSEAQVRIDGVGFLRFEAGDAAMSHYLNVRSYRGVHDGHCYAIDLLVYGTRPEVYAPPATPPFTQEAAFVRLELALAGFSFDR